jgi:uroporphyrinogen-III decarboxylase
MGPDQVLLGNANPVKILRDGTPELVRAKAEECHRDAGARFILGAGCETPVDTPEDNLHAFCQYALSTAP